MGFAKSMKKSCFVIVLLLSLLTVTAARADASASDLKRILHTAESDGDSDDDNGLIRITPDNTKIVRLDQDAASVVVANPAHAAVMHLHA